MPILRFNEAPVGNVISVDTGKVIVDVVDIEKLRELQVNRLVAVTSGRSQQHLIGIIQKITRKPETKSQSIQPLSMDSLFVDELPSISDINIVQVALIGTFYDVKEGVSDVFRRSIHIVPDIDAACYCIEGPMLTDFMEAIAKNDKDATPENKLAIGSYAIDEAAKAYINGDKFFQRHALLVGSTGSGKSWTVAKIIERIALLKSGSAILFDLHGEYSNIESEGVIHYKIASSHDARNDRGLRDGVIYTPYWLFKYEDMIEMLVDANDNSAHNQASAVASLVRKAKAEYLQSHEKDLDFTVDSPIPYELQGDQNQIQFDEDTGEIAGEVHGLVAALRALNSGKMKGARGEKNGPYNGQFDRLLPRLETKISDRRLSFMFSCPKATFEYEYLSRLSRALVSPEDKRRVKIIDLSEVPSDILPLITSLLARIVFELQQWTAKDHRHPVSIFCDEAHLYIPNRNESGLEASSLRLFERIAKEGRKYGVSLVVVSQRPSELNRTVLSQCNNFVAMRLTNPEDQNIIRRLFPDNLEGFAASLPTLDIGEALIVGDSVLLPTRVKIDEPSSKARPQSQTVQFWTQWSKAGVLPAVDQAVEAWRRQSVK